MRKTLLTAVAAGSVATAMIAAPTKSEARCYGCWAGAAIAAGVIGSAIVANRAYGYYGGYGYAPAYYGGYYAPTYYAPPVYSYSYAPAYYGYAPSYYYPRRAYGYYRPYRGYYGGYYGPRRYGYYRARW
jgi:hypothetical protein